MGSKFIVLNHANRVFLRADMDYEQLTFNYSVDGKVWLPAGKSLDAFIISDDYGDEWGFTGAFVGLACQDLTGMRKQADFDFFEYRELD